MNHIHVSLRQNQRGGVSLFIVMFTAIITTIITVSFTQLMIRNQQQASENDLAQRAYDSAMAGVEDAKRVLLAERAKCSDNPAGFECQKLKLAVGSGKCDTIEKSGIPTGASAGTEWTVGKSADNQAYTCVKILSETREYKAVTASDGDSVVVPLMAQTDFNQVVVQWFTPKGSGNNTNICQQFRYYCSPNGYPLRSAANWGDPLPPILRAMLIDPSKSAVDMDSKNGARSVYLYPKQAGSDLADFPGDRRPAGGYPATLIITGITCNLAKTDYACKATLSLGGTYKNAYLHLATIYKGANISVTMQNGGTPVNFYGVQHVVDSTGRAEHLFRRVSARVDLGPSTVPMPAGGVSTQEDLCKAFYVTSDAADYDEKPNCVTP